MEMTSSYITAHCDVKVLYTNPRQLIVSHLQEHVDFNFSPYMDICGEISLIHSPSLPYNYLAHFSACFQDCQI